MMRNVLKWVKANPIKTTLGVGGAVAVPSAVDRATQVERSIMNEYAGTAASKYAGDSFNKFAEHKDECTVKIATDSPGVVDNITKGFSGGLGGGIAQEAIGGLRRLLGLGAKKTVDAFAHEPMRQKLLKTMISKDPYISEFEKQNPGQAAEAFSTMREIAPTLSTDPNVVRSFLRNTAMMGGSLDFMTIKSLAEAEAAVHKAQDAGAWLRGPL
jgi:hypothetical protein